MARRHRILKTLAVIFLANILLKYLHTTPTAVVNGVGPVIHRLGQYGHTVVSWAWVLLVVAAVLIVRAASRHGNRLGRFIPSRSARTVNELYKLSPTEFETAVATLLQNLGYSNTHRVGGSGDLSVDVEGTDANGQKIIAQCKRYAPQHHVGSPEIQQFIGMAYTHHCVAPGNALYFTTASYSAPAIALAAQHHIVLVDGRGLENLLQNRQLQAA